MTLSPPRSQSDSGNVHVLHAPSQPWWQTLDPDFYKQSDHFDLDLRTGIKVKGTVLADLALRTAAASLVTATALPFSMNPAGVKRDFHGREIYTRLADTQNALQVFAPPSRAIDMQVQPDWQVHFRPKRGKCLHLSFDSPFQPVNPEMTEKYLSHTRNRKAHAQYWAHEGSPRPTLCVVHGFMADPYWVNSMFLSLPWFYNQGYNVLLFTLPFHGQRQGNRSAFSGHGFFANGMSGINEAMLHAVHDFRVFIDYLENEGVPGFGCTGISLGGYTTSLLACVEKRLQFAIPNVPVISLLDLMLQWFPAGNILRLGLKQSGISVADARHMLALHCPLTYRPLLPRERLFVIAGAGDRLAPPKHSQLIWEHWGRPRIHWFPGNHVIHLDQGKYLGEMLAFMHDAGFVV